MGGKFVEPQDTAVTRISTAAQGSAAAQACLVMILGSEIGRKLALTDATLTIGRSSQNHLQLDQESVSRNHARLERGATGGYSVQDLGSTNGTFVNNVQIEGQVMLRDGDQIRIGRAILKFISGNNVEAQYHEEIYAMMTTDGLTQVHNKRYFEDVLDRECARCARYGRSFGLVLFDIDHFKHINDTHGHLAGDEVLRKLGTLVHAHIRRNDTVARVGGEEFAVLLPEGNLEGALAFAEKLRKLVAGTQFVFEGTLIPVTISLGAAEWTKSFHGSQDLFKAADAKLYEAKSAGRNRCCG